MITLCFLDSFMTEVLYDRKPRSWKSKLLKCSLNEWAINYYFPRELTITKKLHRLFYDTTCILSKSIIYVQFLNSVSKRPKYIGVLWRIIWEKVLKNGPSKLCGRQPLSRVANLTKRSSFTNFTWSIE